MKKIFTILLLLPLFSNAEIINAGSGSGSINLNPSNFPTLSPGDTINIVPGTYSAIDINAQGADGLPILIRNGSTGTGLVTITGNMYFGYGGGARNLVISGNGKPGLTYGFYFNGSSNRAIVIEENDSSCRNVTFQYMQFIDIPNKTIEFRNWIPYDAGNELQTLNLNVKILHCYFRNSAGIYYDGYWSPADDNADEGRSRYTEVAYCEVHNCSVSDEFVYLDNAESYSMHDNVLDSVNLTFSSHPRIFLLRGNGDFYNNKITNHYGNLAQCQPLSHGTTRKDCYWYNNIVWKSKKYSAFEIQDFGTALNGTTAVGVNFYLINNTVGMMNTNNDWQGEVVDVYDLYDGYAYIRNNASYNNTYSIGDGIINPAGGTNDPSQTVESNNGVYSTYTAAGLTDEVNFVPAPGSPLIGAGYNVGAPVTTDYNGTSRPNPPAIGAVEPAGGTTQLDPPSLTIGTITGTSISLSWSSVTSATNYIVERSTASDFSGATQIYSSSGTSTTATGLTANTTYYFRVKAQAPGFADSDWDDDDATTLNVTVNQVHYLIIKPYKQ